MGRKDVHLEFVFNKLLRTSADELQSHEFLEMMLSVILPKKQAKTLSDTYMDKYQGIRGVFDAPSDELRSTGDAGYKPAILIELVKRSAELYLKEKILKKNVLTNRQAVLNFLELTLSSVKVEKFLALYLNSKNELLAMEVINEGTVNHTVVYPRKILECAFKYNAAAIIFVHNHPSGDPTPSLLDRELTEKLVTAASVVDIVVHDHIIVGKGGSFSAKEYGWFGETYSTVAMSRQNKPHMLHE